MIRHFGSCQQASRKVRLSLSKNRICAPWYPHHVISTTTSKVSQLPLGLSPSPDQQMQRLAHLSPVVIEPASTAAIQPAAASQSRQPLPRTRRYCLASSGYIAAVNTTLVRKPEACCYYFMCYAACLPSPRFDRAVTHAFARQQNRQVFAFEP